jgi:hypothetical protein
MIGPTLKMQLRVRPELVPKPLWGRSGSNLLRRQDWGRIRDSELEKAQHCCAVCASPEPGLICHEQWAYDDDLKIATLSGLEVHCKRCDLVTHMGRAKAHNMWDQAVAQFCAINRVTPFHAETAYRDAIVLWKKRSLASWTVRVADVLLEQYPQLSILVELANRSDQPSKELH